MIDKPNKPLGSPLSPKFNAKFDLKREFESSDLSHNNYSQNVLSSVHDFKTEQYSKNNLSSPTSYLYGAKSPTSPTQKLEERSPFSTLGSNKSSNFGSYDYKPQLSGYSETNQSYSFASDVKNKPSTEISRIKSPNHETVQMFGKETYNYGGPNFSQETMTEVKEIPNGTQKITTTKIYSSTPMKITSTNMKYENSNVQPTYDSMNDFNREFGQSAIHNTDTMKSYTSQSSGDSRSAFMRPSDFQQSDYQAMVTKVPKSPAELAKELDSMERKFMKQSMSSEVVEKKTVMTTSSKSETSSTTMKKFGNY